MYPICSNLQPQLKSMEKTHGESQYIPNLHSASAIGNQLLFNLCVVYVIMFSAELASYG